MTPEGGDDHRDGAGGGSRLAQRVEQAAWLARDAGARAGTGDRPLVIAFVAVLALAVAMLSGPLDNFLDSRGRLHALEAKASALADANRELSERARDLSDPRRVELMAREQLGLVYPGEVPYAIVPPPVDRPRITVGRDDAAPDAPPWYEQVWDALVEAVGG